MSESESKATNEVANVTPSFPQTKFDPKTDSRPKIKIANLIVKPGRGRKDFPRIIELSESLKSFGMLNPIVVEPHPTSPNKYFVVAGERRYRAAIVASWAEVPITLRKDLDDVSAKEIELEENLCREQLSWPDTIELQEQIHTLKLAKYGPKARGTGEEDKGWNMTKTAELVNKPLTTVNREIDFAKKLRERPDLKERLVCLPMTAAMREFGQIMETERLDRLNKRGELVMSHSLLQGDCLVLIKTIKTASIDLVLTDPPFGISTLTEVEGCARDGVVNFHALIKPEDNLNESSAMHLINELMPEVVRTMKPGAHLYMFHCAQHYNALVKIMTEAGLECHDFPLVWYKNRPTNIFTGYNYTACMEPILFAWKPPRTRRLHEPMRALIEAKIVGKNERYHIFQKPLDLLSTLIRQSTDLNNRILDPFAGSGSTVIAAIQCGRSAIGFEKNPEHFLKAQINIAQAKEEKKGQVG